MTRQSTSRMVGSRVVAVGKAMTFIGCPHGQAVTTRYGSRVSVQRIRIMPPLPSVAGEALVPSIDVFGLRRGSIESGERERDTTQTFRRLRQRAAREPARRTSHAAARSCVPRELREGRPPVGGGPAVHLPVDRTRRSRRRVGAMNRRYLSFAALAITLLTGRASRSSTAAPEGYAAIGGVVVALAWIAVGVFGRDTDHA